MSEKLPWPIFAPLASTSALLARSSYWYITTSVPMRSNSMAQS